PASVVALTSWVAATLSGSKFTVAVLVSKSTFTAATPGTFSSAFLTVTGHKPQVMFCTSSTVVFGVAADAASGSRNAMAAKRIERTRNSFQKNRGAAMGTSNKAISDVATSQKSMR